MRRFPFCIAVVLLPILAGAAAFAGSPHSIAIDGVNEFIADETLAGAGGSSWYVTWDASDFFLATQSADVGAPSSSKWVFCYFDTDPHTPRTGGTGSTTGLIFNTQRPILPFTANCFVAWRLDNGATIVDTYNGLSWVAVASPNVQVSRFGSYLEMRIPRAAIGSPAGIYLCAGMLNDAGGYEWTYNRTPVGQPDAYDPAFTRWFAFPLVPGISPNASQYLDGTLPVTAVSEIPSGLRLFQNAPNPFNPRTTLRFDLPEPGSVRLAIYDIAGRLLKVLVGGELPVGSHEAVWDGRDAAGRALASGSYFARLEAGGKVEAVRMSLVR